LIIDGLRQRLMAPELVEEFIKAFQHEINRQRRDNDVRYEVKKRELSEVKRKLTGLIDAIAEGLRGAGLQQRLDELEERRNEIEQELPSQQPTSIRLHPNLAQVYRRQVERLQQALNDPEIRDEAIQLLRGLIEGVSIRPVKGGLEIEIVGEIAKMVELGIGTHMKKAALDETAARSVKVVAGTCNHRELTLPPVRI
jgi:site-specific DNA recombinase